MRVDVHVKVRTLYNPACLQDTIQAQYLLGMKRKHRREEEERRRVLVEGGDLEVEAVRKRRVQQFQNKLVKFQQVQEQKKVEIVARLLREEHTIKQDSSKPHHVKKHEHLRRRRRRKKKREEEEEGKKRSGSAPTGNQSTVDDPQLLQIREEDRKEEEVGDIHGLSNISPGKVDSRIRLSSIAGNGSGVVEQPEIRGLWDETPVIRGLVDEPPAIKRTQSPAGDGGGEDYDKGGLVRKEVVSKAEMWKMQTAMEKLKKNIVSKQVAAGREYKVRRAG